MKEDEDQVFTIVHVYASLERLVQSLSRESLRKSELVSHFIRGFNSISGTMDFVDIGDEGGLMCEKLKGSSLRGYFHLTLFFSDHIGHFSKLPACRFMLLGLDDLDAYGTCLDAVANRGDQPCEVCVIRLPGDKENDLHGISSNLNFLRATLTGLFVPKSIPSPSRISYVDIVQRRVSANDVEVKTEDLSPAPPRKVSNASTATTQAEEEVSTSAPDIEPTSYKASKASCHDHHTTRNSEFSELACTTQRRKMRIEGRKKEIDAKKHDVGLLAVIPCPRDEPDRSIYPFLMS